nr:hypothetical protein [Micromonospora sp. DSM 115978]
SWGDRSWRRRSRGAGPAVRAGSAPPGGGSRRSPGAHGSLRRPSSRWGCGRAALLVDLEREQLLAVPVDPRPAFAGQVAPAGGDGLVEGQPQLPVRRPGPAGSRAGGARLARHPSGRSGSAHPGHSGQGQQQLAVGVGLDVVV